MPINKLPTLALESNAITADLIASGAITAADISDGEITAAKLHTTLDFSTKTFTMANAHVTQAMVTQHQSALSVTQSQISDLSTTSDLVEGTNLYFTNARADARIAAATTSDLTEGTNLYYTDARADARAQLKIDALVDSAPNTLDTLNELASALGDDANFSTTVTNSIATKLPLSGGTMTGVISGFESTGIDDNSNSTAVTILSDGTVGIGTDVDRGGILNVDGTTKGIVVRTSSSSAMELIHADNGAGVGPYLYLNRPSSSPTANDQIGRIVIQGKNSADQVVDYVRLVNQIINPTDGSEQGRFAINTMSSGTMYSRLNIVNGESVFNDESIDVDFRVESNNNDNMLFVDAGNDRISVGSGSTYSMFNVISSNDNTSDWWTNSVATQYIQNTVGHPVLKMNNNNSNRSAYLVYNGNGSAQGFHIFDRQVEQTRISAYTSSVVINEAGADVDFRVASDVMTHALFVRGSDSNVGINTTGPGAKLHVNGTFKLDGNYPVGTSNVIIGDGAGENIASGGSQHTAVGNLALYKVASTNRSTAVGDQAGRWSEGYYNTFIGAEAGKGANGTHTSNSNIAIGTQALQQITSGSNNVAIGAWTGGSPASMAINSSGAKNTAVGVGTLGNNTTASNSTAIGFQALQASNAADNTAVGFEAMLVSDSTSATENTAIGSRSMKSNRSGDGNTAAGRESLLNNVNGGDNVAIGKLAMATNNSGSLNVAVGNEALRLNSSGRENVAVGRESLYNNQVSHNTAIGHQAAYSNNGGSVTAVGSYALYANNSGTSNVAVGGYDGTTVAALRYNSSGDENIGIGVGAGANNSVGNHNTSVGYKAGWVNTSGSSITSVGRYAGYGLRMSNSTAIGARSGYLPQWTGSSQDGGNVMVGESAMIGQNKTAGELRYNTIVGADASRIYYSTTGAFTANAVLGYNAMDLFNQTTGNADNNVAIGMEALQLSNVTTGNASYNTAIGSGAMKLTAVTNSNTYYNTAVGRNSLKNASSTTGNTMIGDNAGTDIQTSNKNTVLGRFTGNSNSVDIRANSIMQEGNIILADGDGVPKLFIGASQQGSYSYPLARFQGGVAVGQGGAGINQQGGVISTSSDNDTNSRLRINITEGASANHWAPLYVKVTFVGCATNGSNQICGQKLIEMRVYGNSVGGVNNVSSLGDAFTVNVSNDSGGESDWTQIGIQVSASGINHHRAFFEIGSYDGVRDTWRVSS